MLDSLMNDILDPGYERAAQRRALRGVASPEKPSVTKGRVTTAVLAVGTLAIGLLLGVAASNTRDNAPGVQEARTALNLDVAAAQDRESVLAASAAALAVEVRQGQSALGGGGPMQTLADLEADNALTEVVGPGLRVTLTDPDAITGDGVILDRDVQLMVNGLWASGAEAVSIGGIRLRLTSAIRQAGGAILVDNRPTTWPLVVEAIGNPKTIHQNFISTSGFGRFSTFVQLYGIGFDVLAVDSMTLPAAAAVSLRYIQIPEYGSAPAQSGSESTDVVQPTR